MDLEILISKYQELPQNNKEVLMDFLDFLTIRNKKKKPAEKKDFSFDWEGGLKDLQIGSVELQHKLNRC